MTTTTPPGWYPEPGHTGNGPALERWWDGSAWTEYTRTGQAFAAPDVLLGYQQPYPGPYGGQPPGAPRRRGPLIAAALVLLVLAGGIVGAIAMLNKDGDTTTGKAGPTAAGPGPGQTDGPPQQSAGGDTAVDRVDGIGLPVPPGWKAMSGAAGAGLTTGDYPCPTDPGKNCVRGGVFSGPVAAFKLKSTTPQAAAEEDIPLNSEESYGSDIYGGITSHKELKSESVTVAGRRGYLVRWQVATKTGDDGYVQSLVFPSPGDPKKLVLVRCGFDINDKAPGLDVMDKIIQGIKAVSTSGGGTGV